MRLTPLILYALYASIWLASTAIKIDLAHGTDREQQTKALLEKVVADYDLRKFTFTHQVVIEERAINHAFPVLTLNVRFANSADELLSSYKTVLQDEVRIAAVVSRHHLEIK